MLFYISINSIKINLMWYSLELIMFKYVLAAMINNMSCLKFNKLVCLNSTRSGKYGSADSKTSIVSLGIYLCISSLMIPHQDET